MKYPHHRNTPALAVLHPGINGAIPIVVDDPLTVPEHLPVNDAVDVEVTIHPSGWIEKRENPM